MNFADQLILSDNQRNGPRKYLMPKLASSVKGLLDEAMNISPMRILTIKT